MLHRLLTSPHPNPLPQGERGPEVSWIGAGGGALSLWVRVWCGLTLLFLALAATLPAAGTPAAGIPVVGQVFTSGGEPAAKAEVRLESIPPTYERAVLRLAGRPGPDPAAKTRTGPDGGFELAAPKAGMWKVVVSAPGMLDVEVRLMPLVDAAELPPLELPEADELEVRLIDAEGKPRPGRVGAASASARGPWRPQLRLADAGEDGVARLPLGKNEKIQLEVLAEGHPLAIFEVFDETSVTIDVPDGVAGTVRAIDRRNRPLAEALAFQGSALLPLGLADEEGRIPLVLQKQKMPALKLVTADRSNGSFNPDFRKTGEAGGQALDLRLDPPDTIRGQVLDLSNRDPVAGALVWAVRGEVATTDARGSYALDVGVYKSRWVRAGATGYTSGHSQLPGNGGGDAPAIGLSPAATLAGQVTDRDGGLLAGVQVELGALPQSGWRPRAANRLLREGWRGRTSGRGAFRIAGLPTGVGYRLTFTAEGFAPRTIDVDPLEPFESRSNLEVALEPGRLAFGRVVDQDQVPIAGAEVSLRSPPPTGDPMAIMRAMRSGEAESDPAHLTGAEGRFEIADLAPGRYDLEVRATGFAPAKVPGVRVTESDARADFGTVILVPGAQIEGRVTTDDGAAVAGAEVVVDREQRGMMMTGGESDRQGEAETDAEGRFVVADLLPGQPVAVAVYKAGFGSELVAGLEPPTEEPLAIVLRPSGRLKGRVVDTLGDPIEGARINAHPDFQAMMSTGRMRMRGQRQRPTWAVADADGAFLIEDVEPGILQISVDADSYRRQERTGVELAAGAELELEFVLEVGALVEGTVTTTDGEPIAEAWINVSEQHDGFFPRVGPAAAGQSGADGRYRVTGAPTGPSTVTVSTQSGRQTKKNVEIRPGTNVVDLELERGFEISGQVVAADGSPVGGANLSVEQIMQSGGMVQFSSGTPRSVTGADGTFSLSGVTAGRYKVSASREGYAQASTEPFEVSDDVSGLLLRMGQGATVRGRVLGLDFDELGSTTLFAFGPGGMRQGRVDFAGEYAIDGLAAGQWQVQAQVGASGRSAMVQIEIAEGESEVVKDVEFGAGFTLTGIVHDVGQPLAGAQVSASGSSGSSGSIATGADGRFRIEGLEAGSYQVMVMAGMGGMQHMEALELTGDHELRIEIATGSLSGRVRDVAGEPLEGVAVNLEKLDAGDGPPVPNFGFNNQAQTDSQGTFRVPRVRQGTWRVVATKPGYGPGEATVAVAGGGAPEIEIRMTPTEGITFEPVLESGLPVQAVRVATLDPTGRPIAESHYAMIDGKVRVSTVPPGRWELVVQAGDSASTRFVVSSPGDQGRLLLPIGGSLQIHVPELEQVPMASVALTGPDGKPFVSTAGYSFGPGKWLLHAGRTAVPGLAPGVWSFTITHEGRTWSGSATVTPGGVAEVSLP